MAVKLYIVVGSFPFHEVILVGMILWHIEGIIHFSLAAPDAAILQCCCRLFPDKSLMECRKCIFVLSLTSIQTSNSAQPHKCLHTNLV